jgi:hypothetical protein
MSQNRYNDGGEIQAKIDRFTKLMNDPRSTEEEKGRYKTAIEKFKAMLPAEEKKEEKKEEKPADKKADKPAEKKEAKKPVEKKADKPAEKKDEVKKKKGLQVLSSKRVLIDGKEVDMDSQEFCDYLSAQWRERREKAEANKDKKKKTKSVMAKVSDKIESGIATAIKEGIKEQKDSINKNPKVFIGKVEKLETATKNFLENLKEVLGGEYDAKEVTSTTKAIQDMINDLKKKYADK